MAFGLSTTWPWSAPGSEFAVVWLVLSGIFVGLGVLVAMIMGDILDGPVRGSHGAVSAMNGALTSVGVASAHDTLLVGRYPRGDEVFVVAFLQGRRHLEAALWAAAAADGWLRPGKDGGVSILDDVDPRDPILEHLKAVLQDPAAGATMQRRLRAAALRLAPSLQTRAERMGLARGGERRSVLILLALVGSLVSLGLGMVRSVAVESLYLLSYGLALHVVVTLVLVMPLTTRHRQAKAYLRWLDGALDATRADVQAGTPASDDDVVLVAAIDGTAGLGAMGQRLGFDRLGV